MINLFILTTLLISFSATAATKISLLDIGEAAIESDDIPIRKISLKSKKDIGFIELNRSNHQYIDIRAYGDSGWSWTHESPAMMPEFGKALDDFSPSSNVYRGDINFMNWESTIGYSCEQWHAPYVRGRSYAFLADPENIEQAIKRGVSNFALSNNHTRDCINNIETGLNGQLTTLYYLENIKEEYPELVYHGISTDDKNKISVFDHDVKGVNFRVAFASYYTGRADCPHSVCETDDLEIINNFKKTKADFKILMIHTMSNQEKLIEVGNRFIKEANGDVVFGSGPHRWKPIRYVQKGLGHGIIFDSLGNFLHPSMAAQSKNIISRILIDPLTKKIVQVQALSVKNYRNTILPSELSPTIIESELEFIPKNVNEDKNVFKAMYFNF